MGRIQELRSEVTAYAAAFDPDACTVAQARQVFAAADGIERSMAAVKAQAAARIAAAGQWEAAGERSAAHQLARETGTTVGAARTMLETGQAMRELPQLAAAAGRGELSATQTAAVAAAGAVAPDLVPALMQRAQETTVAELRNECSRAVAARESDPGEQHRRIHSQRSLRRWVDASGAHVAQLRGTAEMVAGVFTDIAPMREALFHQARQRGDDIEPDTVAADALVATLRVGRDGAADDGNDPPHAGATPIQRPKHRCAPRAKMLIRIDFDTLLRGYPIDGEVCEIAGYGPISVTAVRDMMATGDPFLAGVVTKGERVLGVVHLGRKALAHQQTAIEWLNPTCAVDGCTEAVRLEIDHRADWSKTKVTLVDLLDRLCEHHHDLKTRKNWALVAGDGKRPFVATDDSRHPGRRAVARGDPVLA